MSTQNPSRWSNLWSEASRRHVPRVVAAYILVCWLLAQGFADLFPAFGLPDWALRGFVGGAVAMLPLVVFLAWRYDLTRHGIVRDSSPHRPNPVRAPVEPLNDTGGLLLEWKDDEGDYHSRRFYEQVVVGRDAGVDVRIDDRLVSRKHLLFYIDQGRWMLRDLESSNGTHLNGREVVVCRLPRKGRIRLHAEGPEIRFRIETLEDTASRPAAPDPRDQSSG